MSTTDPIVKRFNPNGPNYTSGIKESVTRQKDREWMQIASFAAEKPISEIKHIYYPKK